jgi:hypothetical protein
MIPVDQTTVAVTTGEEAGDCLRAALASVFEVPLLAIPHFVADPSDEWNLRMSEWFLSRGLHLFDFPAGDVVAPEPHVASGPGPRGFEHSCVYAGDVLVHDPHPARAGLSEIRSRTVFWLADARRFSDWHHAMRLGG